MTIQKTHSADDDMLKRIIELEAANADAVSDYNRCVEDVHAARDRIAELEAESVVLKDLLARAVPLLRGHTHGQNLSRQVEAAITAREEE